MVFEKFLKKAKVNCYANGSMGSKKITGNDETVFIYSEDEFEYKCRHFGANPQKGIDVENVWQKGKIIWGMVSYGGVISNIVSAEEIYEFRKKALRFIEISCPLRGPKNYKEGKFWYTNDIDGFINEFFGTERIFYCQQDVYRLKYQGGRID